MADDNKAVGPLATARLVALIKAETVKKVRQDWWGNQRQCRDHR